MLNLVQHPGVDPESSSGWRIQAIERGLLSPDCARRAQSVRDARYSRDSWI